MARVAKEHPEPVVCTCGCAPVVARRRGGGWIVACPALEGCTNNRNAGGWSTRDEAVADWNSRTEDHRHALEKQKGAKKK